MSLRSSPSTDVKRSSRSHISLDKLSALQGLVFQTTAMVEEAQRAAEIAAEQGKDARTKPERPFSLTCSIGALTAMEQQQPASPQGHMTTSSPSHQSPTTNPLAHPWEPGSPSASPHGAGNAGTQSPAASGLSMTSPSAAVHQAASQLRASLVIPDTRRSPSYTASPMAARARAHRLSDSGKLSGDSGASSPASTRPRPAIPTPPSPGSNSPGRYAAASNTSSSPRFRPTSALRGSHRSSSTPGETGPGRLSQNPLSGLLSPVQPPTGSVTRRTSATAAPPGGVNTTTTTTAPASTIAVADMSLKSLATQAGGGAGVPLQLQQPGSANSWMPSITSPRRPSDAGSGRSLAGSPRTSDAGGKVAAEALPALAGGHRVSEAGRAALHRLSLCGAGPASSPQGVAGVTECGETPGVTPQQATGGQEDRPSAPGLWKPEDNPAGHFADATGLLFGGDGGWKRINFNNAGSVMGRLDNVTQRAHAEAQEGRTNLKSALQMRGQALPDACSGESSALRFQVVAGAVVNSWTNGMEAAGMGPMGSAINATCMPGASIKSKYQFRASTPSHPASSGAASPSHAPSATGASGSPQGGAGTGQTTGAEGTVWDTPGGAETSPADKANKAKLTFSELVYQTTGLNKKGRGRGFRKDITVDPAAAETGAPGADEDMRAAAGPAAKWLQATRQHKAQGHQGPEADAAAGGTTQSSAGAGPEPTKPPSGSYIPAFSNIAQYKQLEAQEREAAAAAVAAAAAKDNPLTGLAAAAALLRSQAAASASTGMAPSASTTSSPAPDARISPFRQSQQLKARAVGSLGSSGKDAAAVAAASRRRSGSGQTGEGLSNLVTKGGPVEGCNTLRSSFQVGSSTTDGSTGAARPAVGALVDAARARAGQHARDKKFRQSIDRVGSLMKR